MRISATHLLDFFDRHHLSKKGKVVVACSGGADSILLLELIHQAIPGRVGCAHFDHQLRKESAADAAFVREKCRTLGIPFVGGRGNVRATAQRTKRGLEETARQIRYAFLEKARQRLGADFILTAHHLDDQAETILFRTARGTKLTGLAGIPEQQGWILRPFLGISKKEILFEVGSRKLTFCTDSTNSDTTIARNFLRHEIMPRLEKINPAVRDALGRLATYATDLGAWVSDQLSPLLHDDTTKKSSSRKKIAPSGHFELKDYLALPRALRGELIRMIFMRVVGSGDGLSEANLGEIDRFLHGDSRPGHKEMFGVKLERRGKIARYGKTTK